MRKQDLDAWDLTLTCGHIVRRSAHRDNDRYLARLVECTSCREHRGVVTADRIGPIDDPDGQVARERLSAELAAAQAKLAKQRKAVEATERSISILTKQIHARD